MEAFAETNILAARTAYSYLHCQHGFAIKEFVGVRRPEDASDRSIVTAATVFPPWRYHVHPSRQAHRPIAADHGGRRRPAAPGLRLRRHVRLRSVPDDGRFPRRPARGLSGRFPVA